MVDLRSCKRGDKLLTREGTVVTYHERKIAHLNYPHLIEYATGELGSRSDKGFTSIGLESGLDIVEICPNKNKDGVNMEIKMDHEVEQVTSFQTKDGIRFNSLEDANAHAAELRFDYVYDNSSKIRVEGCIVDSDSLREWLWDNRQAVMDFLNWNS